MGRLDSGQLTASFAKPSSSIKSGATLKLLGEAGGGDADICQSANLGASR